MFYIVIVLCVVTFVSMLLVLLMAYRLDKYRRAFLEMHREIQKLQDICDELKEYMESDGDNASTACWKRG